MPAANSISMPIIDSERRVIAVCCANPVDSNWSAVVQGATAAVEEARQALHVPPKDEQQRRGHFPAFAIGVSYGGGQRVRLSFFNSACYLFTNT